MGQTLTLEITNDVFAILQGIASRQQDSPEEVPARWLTGWVRRAREDPVEETRRSRLTRVKWE